LDQKADLERVLPSAQPQPVSGPQSLLEGGVVLARYPSKEARAAAVQVARLALADLAAAAEAQHPARAAAERP
jgi:hypothetical protein